MKKTLSRSLAIILIIVALFVSGCSDKSGSSDGSSSNGHEHVVALVGAVKAGYANYGNKKYYSCSCGKMFSDENAEHETTLSEITVRSTTGFDKRTFTDENYSLNYCVCEPQTLFGCEKLPLILFLHGAGERGDDNQSQLKNAVLKVNNSGNWAKSVIITPQCPSNEQWVLTPWANGNYLQDNLKISKALNATIALVKKYAAFDYIDEKRIYVVGLSMGGFGAWDILARCPDLFAAGVPICGGGPTDKINVLKDIPIYAFHGTSDASVPYAGTDGMYRAITSAGGSKMIFYTFSGAGHGIWDDAITFKGNNNYPSVEDWLFSQSK